MLTCEGYKMFKGTATIVPASDRMKPFDVKGTWLYKPEHDTWYVSGSSFPAQIVTDIRDDDA